MASELQHWSHNLVNNEFFHTDNTIWIPAQEGKRHYCHISWLKCLKGTVWRQFAWKHDFPPIRFKCWGKAVNTDNGQRLSKQSEADCKCASTENHIHSQPGCACSHRWFGDDSAVKPQQGGFKALTESTLFQLHNAWVLVSSLEKYWNDCCSLSSLREIGHGVDGRLISAFTDVELRFLDFIADEGLRFRCSERDLLKAALSSGGPHAC